MFPDAPPMDREDVARLVMELTQGHEECLGVTSSTLRVMMKIPFRHWVDFAPAGGLFIILKTCLQHKHDNKLRRFDWQSEKKRNEFVDVMHRCQDDLNARGMRRVVRVAVAENEFNTPEALSRIQDAVKATNAVLAVSANEEGVTHVLHASHVTNQNTLDSGNNQSVPRDEINGDTGNKTHDTNENACIVLGVVGKEALVRYLRYPESYEQWVSLATATAIAQPGGKHNLTSPPPDRDQDPERDHLCLGSWWGGHTSRSRVRGAGNSAQQPTHVFAKWLTDSATFNEWCEEGEYKWEDPATQATRAAQEAFEAREAEAARAAAAAANLAGPRLGDKRPGDNKTQPDASVKREKTTGEGGEVLAPSRFAERVAPNVVKRQIVTPHKVVSAACAGDFGDGPSAVLAQVTGGSAIPGMAVLPNSREQRSVPVLENISKGQRVDARAAAANITRILQDAVKRLDDFTQHGDVEMATTTSTTTERTTHVLPGYAAWFNKNKVHLIEQRGVPEFFTDELKDKEETEAHYTAMRDTVMGEYRRIVSKSKADTLTFTRELQKAMSTSAPEASAAPAALQRVFDFCARWGLVNWRAGDVEGSGGIGAVDSNPPPGTTAAASDALFRFAPAPTNGAAATAAAAAAARDLEDATARVRDVNAPRGVGRPPKVKDTPPGLALSKTELFLGGGVLDTLCLGQKMHDSVPSKESVRTPRACRGCSVSLVGTGRAYYRVEETKRPYDFNSGKPKEADVTCVVCFAAGKLPDGASSSTFTRVVSTDSGDPNLDTSANKKTEKDSGSDDDVDDDADWTDQETLTLLEAVERHGEDWSAVSSRVATKTVEQCVKKFVRIPIEDAFVERLDGGENSDKNHDDTSVPFAQAPNPVMANVAFLATCVCPRVAAAAAKAALVSLSQAADPGGDADNADNADQDLGPSPSVTSEQVVAAAGAGVAAAATHAKLLADRDGHEIEKLAVGVVEMQMRKIELKLRQIEDLDKGLDRERLAVAKMFEQIANERENFERNKAEAEQRAKQAEEEELKRRAAEAEAAAAAAAAAAKAEQERRSIAAMLAASKPPTK